MPRQRKRLISIADKEKLDVLTPKAKQLGISRDTLRQRILHNWKDEDLLTPLKRSGNPDVKPPGPKRGRKRPCQPMSDFNQLLNGIKA